MNVEKSIFDMARENPDQWLYHSEDLTEDQSWDLDEGGGAIRFCTVCDVIAQPNRPCFCGHLVIRRESDGMFWSGDGWVSDRLWEAEHFCWGPTGEAMAQSVIDCMAHDQGPLTLEQIGKPM